MVIWWFVDRRPFLLKCQVCGYIWESLLYSGQSEQHRYLELHIGASAQNDKGSVPTLDITYSSQRHYYFMAVKMEVVR